MYHDKQNAYDKEKRIERRQKILDHYGGKCACCGETTREFLAIDHINNDGHKHKVNGKRMGSDQFARWIIKNNFPDDLQVLCNNCNIAKARYGQCPHQKIIDPEQI